MLPSLDFMVWSSVRRATNHFLHRRLVYLNFFKHGRRHLVQRRHQKSHWREGTNFKQNAFVAQLLLFCEGTRFTREKHARSVEFARKNGLPELKHHLLPRTKGFVHSVNGLKGKGTLWRRKTWVPRFTKLFSYLLCKAIVSLMNCMTS